MAIFFYVQYSCFHLDINIFLLLQLCIDVLTVWLFENWLSFLPVLSSPVFYRRIDFKNPMGPVLWTSPPQPHAHIFLIAYPPVHIPLCVGTVALSYRIKLYRQPVGLGLITGQSTPSSLIQHAYYYLNRMVILCARNQGSVSFMSAAFRLLTLALLLQHDHATI